MAEIRCPECGSRLQTNECPMCMKRVPVLIPSLTKKKEIPWRERKYTSQHENEEEHQCISFDEVLENQPVLGQKPKKSKKTTVASTVIAVIFAVVLPLLGMVLEGLEELDWDTMYTAQEAVRPEPIGPYMTAAPGEDFFLDPVMIYDSNEVTIRVESSGQYYSAYALELSIDNQSQQDITVSSEYVMVDLFMFSGAGFYYDVASGEQGTAYMVFDPYELDRCGIKTISQISFSLLIWDSGTYEDIGTTGAVWLMPHVAEPYLQTLPEPGQQLYGEDGINIFCQGYEQGSDGSCTVFFLVENQSQEAVAIFDQSILVNGEVSEGYFWSELQPGTFAWFDMSFYDMEETLYTMTLHLTIAPWDTADQISKEITLTFTP